MVKSLADNPKERISGLASVHIEGEPVACLLVKKSKNMQMS